MVDKLIKRMKEMLAKQHQEYIDTRTPEKVQANQLNIDIVNITCDLVCEDRKFLQKSWDAVKDSPLPESIVLTTSAATLLQSIAELARTVVMYYMIVKNSDGVDPAKLKVLQENTPEVVLQIVERYDTMKGDAPTC